MNEYQFTIYPVEKLLLILIEYWVIYPVIRGEGTINKTNSNISFSYIYLLVKWIFFCCQNQIQ